MNNTLSGSKYRVSPEGVSLMDETNNLATHLERPTLNHGDGLGSFGHSADANYDLLFAFQAVLWAFSFTPGKMNHSHSIIPRVPPCGPVYGSSDLHPVNLSVGDRSACCARLPINPRSFSQ